MDRQSILYRTLWLFGIAFLAALLVIGGLIWLTMRRRPAQMPARRWHLVRITVVVTVIWGVRCTGVAIRVCLRRPSLDARSWSSVSLAIEIAAPGAPARGTPDRTIPPARRRRRRRGSSRRAEACASGTRRTESVRTAWMRRDCGAPVLLIGRERDHGDAPACRAFLRVAHRARDLRRAIGQDDRDVVDVLSGLELDRLIGDVLPADGDRTSASTAPGRCALHARRRCTRM